jgi:hypothetical protein
LPDRDVTTEKEAKMNDFSGDLGKLVATGLFTIVVALVALIGSLCGAVLASRTNRKTLFVNTVTAERAKWRQDQRTAVSDLSRLTHTALASPQPETLAKLNESRVAIRLRLNPSTEHKHMLDQAILAALGRLVPLVEATDRSGALECLEQIETTMQSLLKQEWDKSKREARKGKLQH